MACSHDFDIKSIEREIKMDHTGSWGGMIHGHHCCGQCKGKIKVNIGIASIPVGNGRCEGACGGKCTKTEKITEVWTICKKCGKAVKQ